MSLVTVVEAMADFSSKRGKQPTHIYMDVSFFKEVNNYFTYVEQLCLPSKLLGMSMVICDPLPMNKKGFFVTA
jgi:hypothetical protein